MEDGLLLVNDTNPVITDKEYGEKFAATKCIETFTGTADNISNHFICFGLDNDDANTFMALLNSEAVEKLHGHLTEQLVKDGKSPVRTITELYEIIATFLIRSRFCLSTNTAYKQFMILLQQNEMISMTSAEHLTEMLPQVHGYDVSRRSGYDSMENTWMQQKKTTEEDGYHRRKNVSTICKHSHKQKE
jgi:hypothetical protein